MSAGAWRLAELASRVGGEVRGDPELCITALAPLDSAGPGALSHLSSSGWRRHFSTTRASAVLVRETDASLAPCAAIVVDDPYLAYARLSPLFDRRRPPRWGIDPRAVVSPEARLGDPVFVGPGASIAEGAEIGGGSRIEANAVVGADARLGRDCRLHAGAVIAEGVVLGARVEVHANAVVGADGFGYASDADGRAVKIAQLGTVRVGDDVEVGASTTIDRGALGDTVIAERVKIDNQVQIGHNVSIGADTMVCGCVGIVGSTRIGRRCVLAGGVGVGGDGPIEVGDGIVVSGMTHVSRSLTEPGVYSSGTLVTGSRRWKRNALRLTRLDEIARRVIALERRLAGGEHEDGGSHR